MFCAYAPICIMHIHEYILHIDAYIYIYIFILHIDAYIYCIYMHTYRKYFVFFCIFSAYLSKKTKLQEFMLLHILNIFYAYNCTFSAYFCIFCV